VRRAGGNQQRQSDYDREGYLCTPESSKHRSSKRNGGNPDLNEKPRGKSKTPPARQAAAWKADYGSMPA
jgi:hypothetical protein